MRAFLVSLALGSSLLAADPGTGEWTMFGNGPSHSGAYPKTIGTAQFQAGWSKTFPSWVNPVAVSGDTIYATTNGYFTGGMRAFALAVADGSEKWSFPLADAYSVNPPAFANGRVYFQRGNHSGDTHLWCLDAVTGRLKWAAPHSAQWERYKAPTIANGGVFVNGGSYGGMYGFDATTGAQRFFISNLGQRDGWTPGYADGSVYACVNGIFTAYEPVNGTQQWTRDLKLTSTGSGSNSWDDGSVPVLSDGKAAIVGGSRLLVVDLASRTQLWSIAGSFTGTPAFVDGVVYAILGSEVKAYSAASGAVLGTFTGMGTAGLVSQPLVTKDLLLAASPSNTYVFDRATFARLQTLPAGGEITYAAGKLYVVSGGFNSPSTLATYTVAATEADPAPAPLQPPPPPESRPNPDRPLGPATAVWLDSARTGGIAYFLFDSPAKIERFDLANGAWRAPISLPSGPKAFAVTASGIYVSFGTSISKFALDGSTETPLTTLAADIRKMFELNGRLYLTTAFGTNFSVIDPVTGDVLGTKNYSYSQQGISVAASKGKFFSRSTGVSPSDILQTSVGTDGALGLQTDGPTHGTYPNATRTYLFPGEGRVVDNAGIIYSTGDLSYLGSLAGSFDDLDFAGDAPVVLRTGNTLVAYSATLAETGRKSIAANQRRLYVHGDSVYAFSFQTNRGAFETKTPIGEIVPPTPGTGIDPTPLAYTPDAIEFDGTDVIYILSKLHQSVFRWSISQRKYLGSIALTEVPQLMTYSAFQQRLYLSYASGRVGKIDLPTGTTETAFVNLAQAAHTMTAVGDSLFVSAGRGGSWMNYHTYSAPGALIATREISYPATSHFWSPATRRLYFISNFSPNDLHWQEIDTEAKFGQAKDSPYHGDHTMRNPVRISPDGSTVVLADGGVYGGTSLSRLGALPQAFTDAAWAGGTLYTLRGVMPVGGSQPTAGELQAWSASYASTDGGPSAGMPLRLFGLSDGLLAVSLFDGKPRFARHALDLAQESSDPGSNPPPPGGLTPHPNPDRPLAQTSAPWLEATQHANISYFLFDTPAKVERYDLQAASWLAPISLPPNPVAFTVSANGIFVSFGKAVSIFSRDGATETPLATTATDVRWLREYLGKLYVGADTGSGTASVNFAALDITTGSVVSAKSFFYSLTGLSFSPAQKKIFGRSVGISPADILQITLNADGSLGTQADSPTHGSYPNATRTFLAPDEAWIADNAGIVYSTADLHYRRSLGGAFDDLTFRAGGETILLRGSTLLALSTDGLETGRKTIAGLPLRIFAGATDVVSFARVTGRGVTEARTPFSELVPQPPPPPPPPPPPSGVNFAELKGTYYGALTGDPSGRGSRGGALTLRLSANGAATGTVQLPTARYSFVTRFDDAGRAEVKVWITPTAFALLTLDLAVDGDTAQLTGSFARGKWSMAFTAAPMIGDFPSGRFLFALTDAESALSNDVPPFAGRGSLVVAASGAVRVTAKLITGESLTQGGWLGADGVSIYLPSRRGANLLAGSVKYEDLPGSDWTGDLQWRRSAVPSAARYSSGIDAQLAFTAAAYNPDLPVFGVFGDAPATAIFYGGNLSEGFATPVTLRKGGAIIVQSPTPVPRLSVNRTTGLLTGFFKHPVTKRSTAVGGVVNQKAMGGTAGFLGSSHAGRVDLGPVGSLSLPTTSTGSGSSTSGSVHISSGSLQISSGSVQFGILPPPGILVVPAQGTLEFR